MFPFMRAWDKGNDFLTGTSPTRWVAHFHRLLTYAIIVVSLIGLTTLATADMGLECIDKNCLQSTGGCHADANTRAYVNAVCEDNEKHIPQRMTFFIVCLLGGIIVYLYRSNCDSDTEQLVKSFNELDYASAWQVVSGEKAIRKYLVNPKCKVEKAVLTGMNEKANAVLVQILLRNCWLLRFQSLSCLRDSIVFTILGLVMVWKPSLLERTNMICNRVELNMVFMCTLRNPWTLELSEYLRIYLTHMVLAYAMFLWLVMSHKNFIFLLVHTFKCKCLYRRYVGYLISMETRWLFKQRFGYGPELKTLLRSKSNTSFTSLEENGGTSQDNATETQGTIPEQVNTEDTVAVDIDR